MSIKKAGEPMSAVEELKAIRDKYRLTLLEICKDTGIALSHLSNILNGLPPGENVEERLKEYLDKIRAKYPLNGDQEVKPENL